MPVLTGPIVAEGALVDVRLGWSRAAVRIARAALRPIPPAAEARALLDTGAECSAADPAFIQSLGLPVGGFTLVNLPALGGMTVGTQHDADVTILHAPSNLQLTFSDVLVVELPLGLLGYQVIIGRDILDLCRFEYDGRGGAFELEH